MTPYTLHLNKEMFNKIRKFISIVILTAFVSTSVKLPAYAQVVFESQVPWMPKPGERVELSPEFTPAYLKGMVIHPDNALQFDFLIYRGDAPLSGNRKQEEYKKLIKYFLASLAIPDEDQWVNLSPYEKDRIIKDDFGKTEMGRDILAQDYLLKQITASLIYPESHLGQKFWDKIFTQAYQRYGTTNIPYNTFNKVWIVPDEAFIYEKGNMVYIVKQHLKVMLEQDYLSLAKHSGITNVQAVQGREVNKLGSQVVREIVLPALEKEVNEGKNFATLRQVYSGMLLAAWYKRALKESLIGKIYANQAKVKGIDQDPKNNEMIYQQYLKAFKKGVFNFIKEDTDKYTNEAIPRKYFSGGFTEGFINPQTGEDTFDRVVKSANAGMVSADMAMKKNKIEDASVDLEPLQERAVGIRTGTDFNKETVMRVNKGHRYNVNVSASKTVFTDAMRTEINRWAETLPDIEKIKRIRQRLVNLRPNLKPALDDIIASVPVDASMTTEFQRASELNRQLNLNLTLVQLRVLADLLRKDAGLASQEGPAIKDLVLQEEQARRQAPDQTRDTYGRPSTVGSGLRGKAVSSEDKRNNPGLYGRDASMKGGIDLNTANLNLQIKRDGNGVPLPISQQDLEHINIDGLVPVIMEIKPAAVLPVFSELKNTSKPATS